MRSFPSRSLGKHPQKKRKDFIDIVILNTMGDRLVDGRESKSDIKDGNTHGILKDIFEDKQSKEIASGCRELAVYMENEPALHEILKGESLNSDAFVLTTRGTTSKVSRRLH